MKDFSHPGVETTDADLNRIIESTVSIARNEWKYVADLELDLCPALPAVPCSEGQIKQVVLNMTVNAAHAITDRYGSDAKGTITISTAAVDGEAEIRIADDGQGMTPEVQARIFDQFFTTKTVGAGTGQGLSLAWDVIKGHGGTIRVESEVGQGTTFVVTLPLESQMMAV